MSKGMRLLLEETNSCSAHSRNSLAWTSLLMNCPETGASPMLIVRIRPPSSAGSNAMLHMPSSRTSPALRVGLSRQLMPSAGSCFSRVLVTWACFSTNLQVLAVSVRSDGNAPSRSNGPTSSPRVSPFGRRQRSKGIELRSSGADDGSCRTVMRRLEAPNRPRPLTPKSGNFVPRLPYPVCR